MKLQGPRPLIEEHYHIQDLIERQERRTEDRVYHQERIKSAEERQKLIDDSKMVTATDFHCEKCKVDFSQGAVLQVELDWSNLSQSIAFYKAKHRQCGNWCIRLVTDKHKDPFWQRSRRVLQERGKYHNDLIQPHETGFNLLYGKGKRPI